MINILNNQLFSKDIKVLENMEMIELNTIISQTKTDELELISFIGKTLERFLRLRMNEKITHDEFKGSLECLLSVKRMQSYSLPEPSKERLQNIIERVSGLLFLKPENDEI